MPDIDHIEVEFPDQEPIDHFEVETPDQQIDADIQSPLGPITLSPTGEDTVIQSFIIESLGPPGPSGPTGPAGPTGSIGATGATGPAGAGDKNYLHVQDLASNTWVINHNLGKFPAIQVIDSAGTLVEGEINHIDINTSIVTFAVQFGGKATCN